jgi:nucleotide-binding universal stress UspA family protein
VSGDRDDSPREGGERRVLVALDAAGSSLSTVDDALEQAVWIAHRLEAELVGLFVEDRVLFPLGSLREIGSFSGTLRTLDAGAVGRSLRSRAALVQARLARLATAEQVRWSFRRVRGAVVDELLGASAECDLFVLGRTAGKRRRPALGSVARALLPRLPRSVLLLSQERATSSGLIVVVHDRTPASERALALALRLQAGDGAGERRVVLLPISEPTTSESPPPELEPGSAVLPDAEWLDGCSGAACAIVEALRLRPVGVLVVGRGVALAGADALVELAEQLDAPLLVVE